jgi:hypothetical protein
MNNRPPPYNPYMYDNQIPIPNVATAPPMDNPPQNIISYQYPVQNAQNSPNYIYNQPAYPPQIYTPPGTYPQQIYTPSQPAFNYKDNVQRYNREEIERRTRREQDECCCIGILATLCCCFMTTVEL